MRLDKLTIGSPKDSPTHQFKNLKNVTIDFDQEHWVTVVIGWNGTGKSNVLEALATIFRDLIQKKRTPAFAYNLIYRMGSGANTTLIQIDADPDREKDAYIIRIAPPSEEEKIVTIQSTLQFDDSDGEGNTPKILLLDYDPTSRQLVREFLGANGFRVYEALGLAEAISLSAHISPDIVITDVHSPDETDPNDWSGWTLAKRLPVSMPKIIRIGTLQELANILPGPEFSVAYYPSKAQKLTDLLTSVKLALGQSIRFSAFSADDSPYLPRYVFSYYSGESTRMHDVYRPYLETYDSKLRKGEDPGLKRLFYALPVHSQFVLLAFLIQQNDVMRGFLERHLGLDPDEGIESVLFVLREPPWDSKEGDPRFWYARGVVSQFLARLYEIALAPIRIKRKVPISLWNEKTLEFLYLYVRDIEALRRLVGDQRPAEFFRDLESTYVSQLIDEVRIRIKLNKNDSNVTFREMSEGEQQLLTVLGLLRFTAGEESLFLLDEPDTHLNPRWSVDYLTYLKEFVGAETKNQETSHIVLTTHNPLSIAELEKGQVQILKRNEQTKSIEADPPELDPKGMGYAGIITSDLFGLGSSLDNSTNEDLINLHKLSLKEDLNETDKAKLVEIRERIEKLDFNFASPDRLEQEFMRARFDLAKGTDFDDPILTAENKKEALKALVTSLLNKINRESE